MNHSYCVTDRRTERETDTSRCDGAKSDLWHSRTSGQDECLRFTALITSHQRDSRPINKEQTERERQRERQRGRRHGAGGMRVIQMSCVCVCVSVQTDLLTLSWWDDKCFTLLWGANRHIWTNTDKHTHTQVCFAILVRTLHRRNDFYTVQTVHSLPLH